jgi:hypothetical protein
VDRNSTAVSVSIKENKVKRFIPAAALLPRIVAQKKESRPEADDEKVIQKNVYNINLLLLSEYIK